MRDDQPFELRLGLSGASKSPSGRSYLGSMVGKVAVTSSALSPPSNRPRFKGTLIGRGRNVAAMLTTSDRFSGFRTRRVFVKTRVVRFKESGVPAAHGFARYMGRGGVTREGDAGRLYSATEDSPDGRAFVERCSGDRHHFRLVIGPEDSAEYDELRPLVRRFMGRIEQDLGTALEWVAADHFDTLVPHAHRLYAAPERVSAITLQPGETLVSVAAGDTARWVIGETWSGRGATRRTHVLVKPTSTGLSTNLMIATDRRVYHVELESFAGARMASIAWTYPDDGLLARKATVQPQPAGLAVAPELAVEALDFNYRIDGDKPPWRPLRAFDDGQQVFIEFPPGLAQGEAPPLFVRGPDGRPELVNYRQRGRYYVVDRFFEAAELRLGGKRQSVVRITHGALRPRRPS